MQRVRLARLGLVSGPTRRLQWTNGSAASLPLPSPLKRQYRLARRRRMVMRAKVFLVVSLAGGSVACIETRCRTPEAHVVDEDRGCVKPAMPIPELSACTPYPPTRGLQVFCLLDGQGQLYLASAGDSETLSGDGWRYTAAARERTRCRRRIASGVRTRSPHWEVWSRGTPVRREAA